MENAEEPSNAPTGEDKQAQSTVRVERIFTPHQLDLIEQAIIDVKDKHGSGAVEIQIRDGRIIGISETRWLK